MEVLACMLCDAAADYGGKLSVLGAFDTIIAGKFPCHHPHCALALRMIFRDEDAGEREFEIKMINSDGENKMPGIRPKILVRMPDETFFISKNLVINLQGIPFEEPGAYSIDVFMDGRLIVRSPLQVLLRQ